jgi:hypothetical protein
MLHEVLSSKGGQETAAAEPRLAGLGIMLREFDVSLKPLRQSVSFSPCRPQRVGVFLI